MTEATLAPASATTREANDAWESLMRAHATLMRHFAATDVWQGLSAREYDVLYTLAKAGGPLRLCDVAEGVLLSQPGLSRLVDRLVERGLVSRCANPQDARAAAISLTDDGRDLQRAVGREHGRDVAAVMRAALSPDQLRALATLTTTLAAATKGA